jgi:uncharacterized protein (TIGR02145 family)
MTTIYTVNNKVLKNSATDKWLAKKEAPGPSFQEVTIGTQTWTAEDLRIDDGQGGITVTQSGGYIYTPAAAARVANSISGWHLPSLSEFRTFVNTVGSNNGTNVMLNGAWMTATTNSTGFNAIPQSSGGSSDGPYEEAYYMLTETINDNETYGLIYVLGDYEDPSWVSISFCASPDWGQIMSLNDCFLRLIKDS